MPIQHDIDYDAAADLGTISVIDPTSTAVAIRTEIQFQHGLIPENGINGVTNEAVLALLAMRIRALNQRFPCRENSIAITKIEEARMWLQERTRLREEQGVEGKHENHSSAADEQPLGSSRDQVLRVLDHLGDDKVVIVRNNQDELLIRWSPLPTSNA